MPSPNAMRYQAQKVFKQLLRLSDKYPHPTYNLASQTRDCFRATAERLRSIEDDAVREHEMAKAVAKAIYIRKEIEALVFLSRYRELKRRYGDARNLEDS